MHRTECLLFIAILAAGCQKPDLAEEPVPVFETEPEVREDPVITDMKFNGTLVHLRIPVDESWHFENGDSPEGKPYLTFYCDRLPEYHFQVDERDFIGFCGNGLYSDPMELTGSVQAHALQYVDSEPLTLTMMVLLRGDDEPGRPVCMITVLKDTVYNADTEFDQFEQDWQIAKEALTELLNEAELTYIES